MVFVGLCLPYSTYIVLLRSIYVVTVPELHSFFITEKYSIVYTYYVFYIYSSIDEPLNCFYLLAMLSDAPLNLGIQALGQGTCDGNQKGQEGRVTRAAGLQWGLSLFQNDLPLA